MKKKLKARHIPNILSLLRIPFSIALLFLAKYPYWFLASYIVAGVLDGIDGILARRYNWTSELGAKMDSIGDAVFLVCAITASILTLDFHFELYTIIGLVTLIVLRLGNMVFTKSKFGKFAYIHSELVKRSTIPVFLLIPICIMRKELLNLPLFILGLFVILASVEETWILAVMEEYDINMKSIYHMKKYKRLKALSIEENKEKEGVQV